jgi:hypothetical protein
MWQGGIAETNRIHLLPCSMQNRSPRPCLEAFHRIRISVGVGTPPAWAMRGEQPGHGFAPFFSQPLSWPLDMGVVSARGGCSGREVPEVSHVWGLGFKV